MDNETPMNTEDMDTEDTTTGESAPHVLDLDTTIRSGGQDVSVAELLKAKEDLDYLRQDYNKLVSFREATTKVMRSDVDPVARETAARHILSDMGYRDTEIDDYVNDWMTTQTNKDTHPMKNQQSESSESNDDDNNARQIAEAILQAQQEAQRATEELHRMKADQLNTRLNSHIVMGLETNQNARTMLNKLEEINGKDALLSARAAIERDIRQQTLENLRSRRTAAGVFEEAWISEESGKATEQVLSKYRSVIGDPNRLGRAPETDSSANEFMNRKPLSAPAWKPGTSNGDIESALDAYNKDALSRLASGLDTGSDGRV